MAKAVKAGKSNEKKAAPAKAAPARKAPPKPASAPKAGAKVAAGAKATVKPEIAPKLSEGEKAPAFSLPADDGTTASLVGLKGKNVVLYFYPKDDTPGCTIEAIAFSASKAAFERAGATVIGVSRDSIDAHCKFRNKHGLSIKLASDTSGEMLEKYGVWVQKQLYGRTYMGIERTTFLIDGHGVIRRIWPKVKVEGHAEEVLAAVKELRARDS